MEYQHRAAPASDDEQSTRDRKRELSRDHRRADDTDSIARGCDRRTRRSIGARPGSGSCHGQAARRRQSQGSRRHRADERSDFQRHLHVVYVTRRHVRRAPDPPAGAGKSTAKRPEGRRASGSARRGNAFDLAGARMADRNVRRTVRSVHRRTGHSIRGSISRPKRVSRFMRRPTGRSKRPLIRATTAT